MANYKSWYLAVLMIALSLLWPFFFTSNTEKELQKEVADKDQQIIELLKERVSREKEISKLQDTIILLNKQISSLKLDGECVEELECALLIKDYERKVGKLEDEIKLLQGQIIANTKEVNICQQLLEDCSAYTYISSERSNDRFYYIIIFGMTIFLCGCCCFCCHMGEMGKRQEEKEKHEREQRQVQYERQLRLQQQQAFMAKQNQPQGKSNS